MSKAYPADQQAVDICGSQNNNVLYKARIKELEARNSRLSRENTILRQQVKELSTDLAEAYDAVGILTKRVMDNERHV